MSTSVLTFRQWYYGHTERKALEDRIINEAYISKVSLRGYLNGRPVPPLKQEKIIEIAGQPLSFPVKTQKAKK